MIHRNIAYLPAIGDEIVYIDELSYEQKVGKVSFIEMVNKDAYFVYVSSPDPEENIHVDNGVSYMAIIVYDNLPNETIEGIYKDTVLGNYGRITGDEN